MIRTTAADVRAVTGVRDAKTQTEHGIKMRHTRCERGGETARPGFLALCRVIRDPSDPARFAGDADPRRYGDWSSARPALLVIEALHQFAVKA
ncbi:hypothetical protein M3622_21645, partial [Bacillus subtilis]|nr:hypothetical protein [Bacillus subtilis]